MAKKTKISSDELDLFHQNMKGVKPLAQEKKIRIPSKVSTQIVAPPKRSIPILDSENDLEVADVKAEDFIAYKHASIPNKTLRKLRKGQYNVEAILDLHGMSVSDAKQALIEFLQEGLRSEMRVVLVIHGKGRLTSMPILKNKLNQWLREAKVVLAFCSATANHGSRGAVYVLLKRSRS